MDARELTRDEKKKIRSLVTGMCANYDRETGLCLPLDCGCYMLHKCWTGAYCRYFREAVLPLSLIHIFHIQTVDQAAAVKSIKAKVSDIDKMKGEEQKKAARAG